MRNNRIGSHAGNNTRKVIHTVHREISFTVILLWEYNNTRNDFNDERDQSKLKYCVGVYGLENVNDHHWPNAKIKTSLSIWTIQVKCADKTSRIGTESVSPPLLTEGGLDFRPAILWHYLTLPGSLFPFFIFLAIQKFSLIFSLPEFKLITCSINYGCGQQIISFCIYPE